MLCVLFAHVLHTKVIDDKAEANRAVFVFLESQCDLILVIAILVEAFLQQLLDNDASLWQAVHSLCNLTVNNAIQSGNVVELVMLNDIL
jgi:hypothetical protein